MDGSMPFIYTYIYRDPEASQSRERERRSKGFRRERDRALRGAWELVGTALDLNIINDVQSNQGAFRGCHQHQSEMKKIPKTSFVFLFFSFLFLSYQSLLYPPRHRFGMWINAISEPDRQKILFHKTWASDRHTEFPIGSPHQPTNQPFLQNRN